MECKSNRAHQEVHWQSETYEQPTFGVRKEKLSLSSTGRSLSYSKKGGMSQKRLRTSHGQTRDSAARVAVDSKLKELSLLDNRVADQYAKL